MILCFFVGAQQCQPRNSIGPYVFARRVVILFAFSVNCLMIGHTGMYSDRCKIAADMIYSV
jgi:hypothetical protein